MGTIYTGKHLFVTIKFVSVFCDDLVLHLIDICGISTSTAVAAGVSLVMTDDVHAYSSWTPFVHHCMESLDDLLVRADAPVLWLRTGLCAGRFMKTTPAPKIEHHSFSKVKSVAG